MNQGETGEDMRRGWTCGREERPTAPLLRIKRPIRQARAAPDFFRQAEKGLDGPACGWYSSGNKKRRQFDAQYFLLKTFYVGRKGCFAFVVSRARNYVSGLPAE